MFENQFFREKNLQTKLNHDSYSIKYPKNSIDTYWSKFVPLRPN